MLFDTKFIVRILLFFFIQSSSSSSYEDKDKNGHLLERDSFIATPLLLSANFDRLGGAVHPTLRHARWNKFMRAYRCCWLNGRREKEKTRSRASFYDGETIDTLRKRACIGTIYGRYIESSTYATRRCNKIIKFIEIYALLY